MKIHMLVGIVLGFFPLQAAAEGNDTQGGSGTQPAGSVRTDGTPCLARLVCEVKNRVRWRSPAWDEKACQDVAAAIQEAAQEHALAPELILATALNESELDEKAHRDTYRGGKLVARDSGLMAIRCVLGQDGKHCVNGLVRGMLWKDLMKPATNIAMGAKTLAYFRDGGAVSMKVVHSVDRRGRPRAEYKAVACRHRTHAWWVHYNHGPSYIDHGPPRHYAHRIAVLYAALLHTTEQPITAELRGPITITDKGARPRTIDKPVGVRQRRLVAQILDCHGACSRIASATMGGHAGATEATRVSFASAGNAIHRSRRALP